MRHGTYRGMSYRYINEIFKRGHVPIKDCDLIGVNALKKAYPNRVLTIFVTAPKEQVRGRLASRGDKEADIEVRLKDYDNYVKEAGHYDNQVQNIVLGEAIREIDEIIINAYEALL
jgi:guanylate kinase